MALLTRITGVLLTLGAMLFAAGGVAWFRDIRTARIQELTGFAEATPQAAQGWLTWAPWLGILLMALGVIFVIAVLIMALWAIRPQRAYVTLSPEGTFWNGPARSSPLAMRTMTDTKDVTTVLNTCLQVEYSFIVNLPRQSSRFNDEELMNDLRQLAQESLRHFDRISSALRRLGTTPIWGFELEAEGIDTKQMLLRQLDKERLAKMGYEIAVRLTSAPNLQRMLLEQVSDEDRHIAIVQRALDRLSATPQPAAKH